MSPHIDTPTLQSIPEWVKSIDGVANIFFSTGFILNRLKDLPLGPGSLFLSVTAMLSFAIGNALQSISSTFYHCQGDKIFSRLFTLSSLAGTFASLGILLMPQAWIIWIWLFALNNSLWLCAEYYRKEHPSSYPILKYEANSYLHYVKWLVGATFCSCVMNTLCYFFSMHAKPLFMLGLIGNYLSTIYAFLQLEAPEDNLCPKKY